MSTTVADFMIDRLQAWGVDRIYGYPDDGINGMLGALDRANGDGNGIELSTAMMAATPTRRSGNRPGSNQMVELHRMSTQNQSRSEEIEC